MIAKYFKNLRMKPRNASTLIINNRSSEEDNTVLMLLRHPGNAFVPSAWVFPGGGLEDNDEMLKEFCVPLQDNYNQVSDSDRDEILPYFIASIRETFEETRILYAYDDNGLVEISKEDDIKKYDDYRTDLLNGKVSFKEILEKENLKLAVDCLSYIDRWVTPALYPIRYDARFFYTETVPPQKVAIDDKEVVQFRWVSPYEAIRGNNKGDFPMVLPTVSVLKKIS